MSAGAAAPTKLKIDAPAVPGARPRRVGWVGSISRMRAVRLNTDLTSIIGAMAGGGMGDGRNRSGRPSSIRIRLVVDGARWTTPARSRRFVMREAFAMSFDAIL